MNENQTDKKTFITYLSTLRLESVNQRPMRIEIRPHGKCIAFEYSLRIVKTKCTSYNYIFIFVIKKINVRGKKWEMPIGHILQSG